jgi:DNA-binding LytR/AlgR family response regulator
MEITVLIVEDEELYADKMEMQLDKLGYRHLDTVDNSNDALVSINKEIPDIILMDINIQGEYDGIELADKIHKLYNNIPILFITSLQDNMTFRRASRTNPVGFLTKPFNELQLQRSLELIVDQLESNSEDKQSIFSNSFLFIKNQQKLEKVYFKDIFYLEADGRYTKIITKNKKYLLRRSLQDLISKFSNHQFVQTHRSFVLNLQLVTSVDLFEHMIYLDKYHVPLSRRNKDTFLEQLEMI